MIKEVLARNANAMPYESVLDTYRRVINSLRARFTPGTSADSFHGSGTNRIEAAKLVSSVGDVDTSAIEFGFAWRKDRHHECVVRQTSQDEAEA